MIATMPVRIHLLYFIAMNDGNRKKGDHRIFDSIRKPTAPPSRTFGEEKPEEKARPSGRKAKHKKKTDPKNLDGDL